MLNLNERRTRRGVYAVSKPNSESSDESDEGEDGDTKPLADASDIPGDGEIELTVGASSSTGATSMGRNSSTPVSFRSPSSLTELTPSPSGPSPSGPSAKDDHSTPFRSIISTRSQKARETSGSNSSTPLKESSRSGSIDTPSRATRTVPFLRFLEKSKGKAKASPVPSVRSSVVKQSQGPRTDTGKNEGGDAQAARTRPDTLKENPEIAEVPRGVDGKPLPTCVTCSNVLPLISIASKVVWGLETGKRKRECPRYVPGSLYMNLMVTLNDSTVVYATLRSMKCHGRAVFHLGRQRLPKNQLLRTLTRRM